MNKFIKQQLEKCKIAKIPAYSEKTTFIKIPRTSSSIWEKEPISTSEAEEEFEWKKWDYLNF